MDKKNEKIGGPTANLAGCVKVFRQRKRVIITLGCIQHWI